MLVERIGLKLELERIALLIAVAGSIANAHAYKRTCSMALMDADTYLTPRFKLLDALHLFGKAGALEAAAAPALSALHSKLAFTRDLLSARTSPLGTVDPAAVSDAVRRLASLCFIVRNVVDRVVDPTEAYQAPAQRRQVDALLRAVAAGGMPCLDDDGTVSVPGWAERRIDGRARTDASVLVSFDGKLRWTTVTDVSRTGLGLVGLDGVLPGARLTVHTRNRTSHSAQVVWTLGDRAGLDLDRPMSRSTLEVLLRPPDDQSSTDDP
jgi:hypothetical protein